MKSTRNRFLAIGAAVMLAVAVVFAQGMHGHHGPDGDFNHMLKFFTNYLDLNSAQQEQAKAIWEKEQTTIKPLMQQERQNRQNMRALEKSGPFDEAKTRVLATQNAQTMIELQVAHARLKSEMVQILTADQKAKLDEFEAKKGSHWKGHTAPPAPPAD
jgi:periplasmic protein CpxP/Spy